MQKAIIFIKPLLHGTRQVWKKLTGQVWDRACMRQHAVVATGIKLSVFWGRSQKVQSGHKNYAGHRR